MISVRKKRKQRGLAIIELLLVFAILGVIAVVIVLASGFIQKQMQKNHFNSFNKLLLPLQIVTLKNIAMHCLHRNCALIFHIKT